MDFTYYIAGLLSFFVGFVGAIIFVALGGENPRRLVKWCVAVSVIADFALLTYWVKYLELSPLLFLVDLVFFLVFAFIGCSFGASPVLFVRDIVRKLRKSATAEPGHLD
ncbi:MAG: hypothetical protein AAF559_05430 [Pseudomonadota bacterium]